MTNIGSAKYGKSNIQDWAQEDEARNDKMFSLRLFEAKNTKLQSAALPNEMDLDEIPMPGDMDNEEMNPEASLEGVSSTMKSTPGRIAAALIPETIKLSKTSESMEEDIIPSKPKPVSKVKATARAKPKAPSPAKVSSEDEVPKAKAVETPAARTKAKRVSDVAEPTSDTVEGSARSTRTGAIAGTDTDAILPGHPRRRAAAAASEKVKAGADDMNKFAKERRYSSKRLLDECEEQLVGSVKKSRQSLEKGKGKGKVGSEDEEMESEEDASSSKGVRVRRDDSKDRKKGKAMPNKTARKPPVIGNDSTRGPSQANVTSFDAPPGYGHLALWLTNAYRSIP